jgi:alpha-tubulin suppressor-like RCC1 family protein
VPDGSVSTDGAASDAAAGDAAARDAASGDAANSDAASGDGGGGDAGMPLCSGRPLSGVRMLSVGGGYACAVTGAGLATEVLCWGAFGNIGDPGGVTSSPCPVAVPALSGLDIASVFAGGVHACAVTSAGAVICWGINLAGKLGRGTLGPGSDSLAPAVVPGVLATGVVADWANTCIWRTGAEAQCWGSNLWGQLGRGPCRACTVTFPGTDSPTPAPVTVVSQPQDLALAGGGFVCGIIAGAAECWGRDVQDELGMGGGTVIDDAVDVAAGESYGCAVRGGDGSVHCWGENFYGNLGDGTTTSRPSRAPVVGLPGPALAVDAGNHTCAVLRDGSVYCWGDARNGRVRPGLDVMAEPVPQRVIASGATHVEVGALFSCAQVGDQVRCWGQNGAGQLGDGSMDPRDAVITVLGP